MKQYDYLIVGAGLFGAVFAHEAKKAGKKCLVVDKRDHIAGNIYTEAVEGINVHRYGAHIFHTNNKAVWQYVNQFAEFNRYTNSPVANYHGQIYNLPFNMNTFNKMWGVVTPAEAKAKIEEQKKEAGITDPQNLEEQAISLVGTDIYEKLIKGYTGKQWGRPCTELPAFIIKRLPVRFTYDNNYFNALYQGIPNGGYTAMVENMLEGTEVRLNVDYLADREALNALAEDPTLWDRYGSSDGLLYTPQRIASDPAYRETLALFEKRGMAVQYRIAQLLTAPTLRLFGLAELLAEAVREKPAARSGTEAETPELFAENGRWGYRTAERVVVAPLYDNGFDFTEGLAAVQLGGTWHYIDTAGRTRLSCPGCAAVKPFRGGKAQVVRNGRRIGIDRAGTEYPVAENEFAI